MNGSKSNHDSDKILIPQVEVSNDLRNSLWNIINKLFKNKTSKEPYDDSRWTKPYNEIAVDCFEKFFKLIIDEISSQADEQIKLIKKEFLKMESSRIYEFLEFLANDFDKYKIEINFRKDCDKVLNRENSGYLFVGKKITKISSKSEIQSLEDAQKTPYKIVNQHIEAALGYLSDESTDDYRNSIKESISAVEALVGIIQEDPKKTLSELLKQKKLNIHPALRTGLLKIYSYTSDADGIRHALTEDSQKLTHSDALFMAVVCSAFVNYIMQKQANTD